MHLRDIHEQILKRRWNWNEMPDSETEGIIDRLIDALRPEVPQVGFEGTYGWAYAVGSIVVRSHPVATGFHSDLSFWERFTDDALHILHGEFSSRSKVYQTYWNVFPRRHVELLQMPAGNRSRLPDGWQRAFGPYFEATPPNDQCRHWEELLRAAFDAEGFYYLPNDVLDQPRPLLDQSPDKDGTMGTMLFGMV